MNKIFEFIWNIKYFAFIIFLFGFVASLFYALMIYPMIETGFHAVLDSDGYGALGRGIFNYGTLSYYPDTQPTINRGPLYPAFISALLFLFPNSESSLTIVQIAQCLLTGLIVLNVYIISKKLWNKKIASIASLITAIHPLIIWYSSRIWIETLSIFLFTSIAVATLYLYEKPTKLMAILCGLLLGLSILCKQTFLPFIVVIPFLIWFFNKKKFKFNLLLILLIFTLLIITPWAYRNYLMSGKFIPVHLLAGYNLQKGDSFSRNFHLAPLSYSKLFYFPEEHKVVEYDGLLLDGSRVKREVILDSIYTKSSIDNYLRHPLFLVKKILINSVTFWYLGETELKSLVIMFLQLPVLIAFIVSTIKIFKRRSQLSDKKILMLLVLAYFLIHLPIFSFARLSLPVVPLMISVGSGLFLKKPHF